MGSGGSSDYQRALQQRQQREARINQQRSEKLTAAQEKEKEVMVRCFLCTLSRWTCSVPY